MFEQSVVAGHPSHTGVSVLISLTGQLFCLCLVLLLPLLFTQSLGPTQWARVNIAAPVPPSPQPVQTLAASRMRTNALPVLHSIVFSVPQRIPTRVAEIVDPPSAGIPGSGGADFSRLFDGALGTPVMTVPPPAPTPVPTQVEKVALKPITVSSGVQAAKMMKRVIPTYPELAKRARISGTVRLVGVIGLDGTIQRLQVISGPPLLVQSALDAVSQWAYRPTLLNGTAVEVIAPIDVVFTLN